MSSQAKHSYVFGPFRLDPAEHLLLREGHPVPLPPKAFATLLMLVQQRGHVLGKDELMRGIWPGTFVEENNLTQCVSTLRKALADGQNDHHYIYIETVPRLGYRFVAPVREVWAEEEGLTLTRRKRTQIVVREEKEEDNNAEETAQKSLATGKPVSGRRRQVVWWAAAIVVVGLTVTYFSWLRPTKALVQPIPPRTLAVLPFRNLRADPESDFLGVALADVASAQLSYSSEIALYPSSFVLKYRGYDPSLERAAQAGHVQWVLTGSYLKEGESLRLSVEVVAEPSHVTVSQGTFAAGMEGLITLQDVVAEQVGGVLHVKVPRMAGERLRGAPTQPNPMGYEYLLRGVDAGHRLDLNAAMQWHEKAVNLDPDFGPALAHLASDYISYCYGQSAYPNLTPVEPGYIEKSLALYQRALDAGAASPAILSQSGLYLIELGRLDEAVALLRSALQLNSNYAEGHLWLSQAYRYGGMLQESQAEAELALRLNPNVRRSSTVNTYLYLGEYDKFVQSMPQTQLGARILFYRGLAYYYNRDLRQAEKEFQRAYELEPAHPHAQYARAFLHVLAGENDEGIRQLRSFERSYQADGEMLYKMAQLYALLGDKPSGLRLLRRTIERNFYCYPYFASDPLLENLRAQPEYSALLELARQRHETFRRKFF